MSSLRELASRRRHHLEDVVAIGVAIGVVDRLEAVQVEVHDRGLGMAAVGVLQGGLDAVFQQAAVGQAGEGVVQRQLLLRARILGQLLVEQAYFQHVVDALVHLEQVEGLADEVAGAGFQRGDLEARLGGQRQHRQVAALFDLLQALHHLEAVQAGHLQVEQDQVVVVLAMQRAYLLGQHRRTDAGVAFFAQYLFHQLDIVGRIVHHQDLRVQNVLSARHARSLLLCRKRVPFPFGMDASHIFIV